MATSSISSTQITNRDATPRVLSQARITKGAMQTASATLETLAADDIGSKYKLVQVPSNARICKVLLSCDSLGTAGSANVGIYQTTANGGAVVDADFFAATQVLTSALKNSDITFQANGANQSNDISFMERPLWQALGLSSDPKIDYDVVATLVAATVSAGTVSMQVEYAI